MIGKYRYKGKHRAVSRSGRTAACAATAIGLTASLGMSSTAYAQDWGPIRECESSNSNIENDGPSTASGYYQFIDSTWVAYGGLEFSPRAIGATLEEQTIVANRAYDDVGYTPWAASESCWDGKVGTAPKPSPKPRPKAAPVSAEDTYKVRSGDTLSGIAAVRSTSWQHLYEMNPQIADPDRIYPGNVLDVTGHPAGTPAVVDKPAEAEVKVVPAATKPVGVSKVLASQPSTGFDGVKSHVAQAGHLIQARFGVDNVGGVADRSRKSDHPKGLALDFMVSGEEGDQIAEFALANKDVLNVKYVIWEQRINHGDGWEVMEDRGSDTANHMDHVHVSFND